MQYLLTQEELDALKAKRGVDPEVLRKAKDDLGKRLIQIATDFQRENRTFLNECPMIAQMRKAVDLFHQALDEPINKAT